MTDGTAGATAHGADGADRSETSEDPPSQREQLAGDLESLARELRRTHRKLTKTAPQSAQRAFWEEGLEKMQEHLDEVVSLLERCQNLADAEKKAAADPAGAVLKAKPEMLSQALDQLDDAIILAFQKANAARHSLEMRDQDFSAQSRSKDFVEAAGQLKELAGFSKATAVQLRGPAALVSQASADQGQGPQSELMS